MCSSKTSHKSTNTKGFNFSNLQFNDLITTITQKKDAKKVTKLKMGGIYEDEAWTEGTPNYGWAGLAKDPNSIVPMPT